MCPELFPAETLQSHLELPLKEKYKDLATGGPEHEKLFFAQQNQLIPVNPKTQPPTSLQRAGKLGEFESPLGSYTLKDVSDAEPLQDFLSAEEVGRRQVYVWQETKDVFMESAEVIKKLAAKFGNVYSAMDYIVLKGDKRTPEEQKVIDGMDRIDKLMSLHEDYKNNIAKYMMLHPVLPFPMPEYLQKLYQEKLRYLWQECYVEDITEYLGIPDKTEESKKELELRYQRAMDMEAMTDKDRKTALKLIEEKGDELIVRRSLSAKDEALISKMNILANTVEVKRHPEPRPDFSVSFNPEMLKVKLRQQMAVDVGQGLLSPENIVKVLYLNNARPGEFDLLYWAEAFNLPPQKIRNIFSHISYPVIINNTLVGKLAFIDIPRKKTVVDLEEENLKQFRSQNGKGDQRS